MALPFDIFSLGILLILLTALFILVPALCVVVRGWNNATQRERREIARLWHDDNADRDTSAQRIAQILFISSLR